MLGKSIGTSQYKSRLWQYLSPTTNTGCFATIAWSWMRTPQLQPRYHSAVGQYNPVWCSRKIKENCQLVPSARCVAAQHDLWKKRLSHLKKSHVTELCIKDVFKVLDASYQKGVNEHFTFLLTAACCKCHNGIRRGRALQEGFFIITFLLVLLLQAAGKGCCYVLERPFLLLSPGKSTGHI